MIEIVRELRWTQFMKPALRRNSAAGAEAAFKYFLLGAFSSAFFLYGIAVAYALTGSTRLDRLASYMASGGERQHVDPLLQHFGPKKLLAQIEELLA